MARDDNNAYEVAIIGLGPVGATLANLLGQMGISTVALELDSEISQMPRAVAFDDEAMRIFQAMGLSEEMNKIAEVGEGAKFVDSNGKTLVHWERPIKLSPNGWYLNYRFNQPELEQTLRHGTTRFSSVTLKPGCEVTDFQEDEDGVAVTYIERGVEQELRATYVVGCDGGRSFTRGYLGGTFEDLGFHEEWLIVDLLLPEREPEPDRFTYHYCGFSRMGSKVFVGSARKRWEFRLKETDKRETVQSPEVVWKILEPWISPSEAEIERTALYTFHSTIADKWRNGRILIAGDAAHQTPPFMAQGMCAGIRDASNLAWKLERVLRHTSSDQLLDSYQSERSPHVREYINLTIEFGQLINNTVTSLTGGNLTNLGDGKQTMSQLRPKLGPGISACGSSKRGRLLPQFVLKDGRLLDDVVGYRTTLIFAGEVGINVDESLRSEFLTAGVETVDNPGAELTAWLGEAGAIAVLVGADRNVLGTASSIKEIAQLHPSMWKIA
jgi:3-(3-hydroxy-phenyl)propionate hydroxylase